MPCPSRAPRRPAGAKRTAIYLMVSDWPSRKVKAEPQIVYGYQGKENGAAALGVGSDKFPFFIRNNGKDGSAWLQQLNDNSRLIDAMHNGVSAVASGTSSARHQDQRHLQPVGLQRRAGQDPRRLQHVMAKTRLSHWS